MFCLKIKTQIAYLIVLTKLTSAFFGDSNLYNTHEEPKIDISENLKSSLTLDNVKEKWIKQKLNNFNENDKRLWSMRYLENNVSFKPGGPIFIFVGGEWSISSGWLVAGHMFDMAKKLNGIMYYTEHRFYGKSHPTENTSIENLKYLTVHQAIADLGNFIEYIKNSNNDLRTAGVILIGASYSATVATWTRKKFPHLVNGVWASSAPLFAKLDFFEYNEIMTKSVRLVGGEKCLKHFENAFKELENIFAYSEPKLLYKIQKDFNLCEPIKLCRDTAHFFYEISDTVAGLVQKHRYVDIQMACDFISQETFTDDVEALGAWINIKTKEKCIDMNYDNLVKKYKNTTWESDGNKQLRQWIYQTCDTFAWFQSATSLNQVFGSRHPQIGYFIQMCRDFYGDRFNENSITQNVNEINEMYGGIKPQVTNVYFTQGYLDPWKEMGAQSDLHKSSPTAVIHGNILYIFSFRYSGYSHCADLYSISERDTPEMKASKLRISSLVQDWLNLK